LCANWLRIKGDSRLTLQEALQAMHAAWHHAEQGRLADEDEEEETTADEALLAASSQGARHQPAYAAA
jgi:hypothetical protein